MKYRHVTQNDYTFTTLIILLLHLLFLINLKKCRSCVMHVWPKCGPELSASFINYFLISIGPPVVSKYLTHCLSMAAYWPRNHPLVPNWIHSSPLHSDSRCVLSIRVQEPLLRDATIIFIVDSSNDRFSQLIDKSFRLYNIIICKLCMCNFSGTQPRETEPFPL